MKKYQLEIIGAMFLCMLLACLAVALRSRIPDRPLEQLAEEARSQWDMEPPQSDKTLAPRSSKWKTVRDAFVEQHPACEACGATEGINVHHVLPFHDRPDLELDSGNLISLCGSKGRNCHFYFGHDPDGPEGPEKPNWNLSNPNVREDAAKWRAGK